MKLKILLSTICLLTFLLVKSQVVPYWKLGGNAAPPLIRVDNVNATNNFFGTAVANNIAVRMGTAGISRMFMQNNTGATAGFIGIGPSFTAPQSLLHLNLPTNNEVCSQYTNLSTGSAFGDGLKVGVVSGFFPGWAIIDQQGTKPLWFLTSGVSRMIINGSSSGATEGFVGIGNFLNPGNSLEIKSIIASSGTANNHPASTFGAPTGTSGLRFTNLNSNSVPEANPGKGVLSLNATGDVIIVPGGGAGGVTSCNTIALNFLPKWSNIPNKELCQSIVYDDGTRVGISTTAPQSLLHINDGANAVYTQVTNTATGATAADGLKIGLAATAGVAEIRQQENADLNFFTNNFQHVTMYSNEATNFVNGGGVGIHLNPAAPITIPRALLHIGEDIGIHGFGGGQRPWMRVGVFCGVQSDNMYVGIKEENDAAGFQNNDAIINWADDGLNPSSKDYMRFIFTTSSNIPFANGSEGLEIARLSPTSHMGIGNFVNNPLFLLTKEPARRLEILSDKTAANINGAPQVRLTHSQEDPANIGSTGKFTEMETTHFGDLAITTFDNTQVNTATRTLKQRFVGINTNIPGNTLEVNSQFLLSTTLNGAPPAPGFGASTGASGLRFTDLINTSIPQANPGSGVLSVNANGDVIYVPVGGATGATGPQGLPGATGATGAAGTSNAHNGASISTITPNYVAWGQDVNATATPGQLANPGQLLSDREIPLNGKNIFFTGQDAGYTYKNDIFIGYDAPLTVLPPESKFSVIENVGNVNATTYAGHFRNIDVGAEFPIIGLAGISDATQAIGGNTGGYFAASGSSSLNLGVDVEVNAGTGSGTGISVNVTGTGGSSNNVGFNSTASGSSNANWGAIFTGSLGQYAYGVSAKAAGGTVLNRAIWGIASPTDPNSYAGYFDGNVNINGTATCSSGQWTSDKQFKTNIDSITNALGIIKQMQPKTFNFDTANVYGMNFSSQKQYGLIAQQVETVLPELISNMNKSADLDSAGNVIHQAITYKTLNYNAFIAILMKGIQEQQKTIDSLRAITNLTSKTTKQDSINAAVQNQLTQLSNSINACCNAPKLPIIGLLKSLSDSSSNQTNVNLNNSQTIVLAQNVPNPFAEQTTINYFLPDNIVKAQMLFYDAKGMLINSVDLIQKGKGSLNVFAQDLTNGIYTYTLVVDGNIIETKKMVKQ